jgi:hypothetical protein
MLAAGIGLCTRISQEYGPRYGPVRIYSFQNTSAVFSHKETCIMEQAILDMLSIAMILIQASKLMQINKGVALTVHYIK